MHLPTHLQLILRHIFLDHNLIHSELFQLLYASDSLYGCWTCLTLHLSICVAASTMLAFSLSACMTSSVSLCLCSIFGSLVTPFHKLHVGYYNRQQLSATVRCLQTLEISRLHLERTETNWERNGSNSERNTFPIGWNSRNNKETKKEKY